MQSASQSGPGFQKQQGAPILMRAREAAPQIAAGSLIVVGVLCLCMVGWVKFSDYQTAQLQMDVNALQAQTEASAFAVDQVLQCKHESAFRSFVNPNAACINQVVNAAQNLTGDHVVGEVTRHLGTWADKSTRLQALGLGHRHITSYLAKYGFSLLNVAGNMASKAIFQ